MTDDGFDLSDRELGGGLYLLGGTVYAKTQADVGALLGVNRRTVIDYARAGMPGRPGAYPTAAIVHWYAEREAGRPLCRECGRPL